MTDNLTPTQRSYCMSRVKGKNTGIERFVHAELRKLGYCFKTHLKDVPGKPDIAFVKARVAVFLDGDFWHGYRFPDWHRKVSPFWRKKISGNRRRDRNNFAKLR